MKHLASSCVESAAFPIAALLGTEMLGGDTEILDCGTTTLVCNA